MNQQQQTQKKSGSQYHLNLDSISFAALNECHQIHRNHGNQFSNSVIVRRALRSHLAFLKGLAEDGIDQEITEMHRAAKGIR